MAHPPVLNHTSESPSPPALDRSLGLLQASALNITNMVGIGPFITIPLFLTAMHGPQAMVGWIVAAVLVLCDGLVWSELGAALPGSGGSYHYLRVAFAPYRWGRLMPFLFIWQFLISGTLELASGYIGALDYVKYALPQLEPTLQRWHIPGGLAILAAISCIAIGLLLCRRIRIIGSLAVVWFVGTIITVLIVIVAGLSHFNPSLLRMPPGAFHIDKAWIFGLGGAMQIAVYDYLGYYNICHLGDEVRNPAKTIPRAVIISVLAVAALYLTMNISIIAVVPWQEAMQSQNIAALFMERIFSRKIAVAFSVLIIWTAAACVFSMTLGYSRIPYAAARQGDFFPVFGRLHSKAQYPWVSLLTISGLTAVFCFLPLQQVIDAAVSVRILIQFVGQIVALHILRTTRPDVPLPFRMRLYPIPSLLALIGWLFMWGTSGRILLLSGFGVIAAGTVVFFVWQAVAPARRSENARVE
jgi:amino acid transporter